MEEIVALGADNLPHRIAMINSMLKHGKKITQMKADDDGRIRVFFGNEDTTPPFTKENNPMPHIDEDLGPPNFGGTRLPASRRD
jgi:hypothetical protein